MKKQLILFTISLFCLFNLSAQTKSKTIADYFSKLSSDGEFNGQVLVAENGKIVYRRSFGYADFEDKIPVKENTLFSIASLSKTINATAVLQLAEGGKLEISAPVKKYLTWFPYDNILIRHLLSHTSGLPPYNAFFDSLRKTQPQRVFTNADFEQGVLSNPKPLIYQPGEKGTYDNVNFLVMALVIEKVAGMSHEEYVSEKILKPAKMKDTRIVPGRIQYNDSALPGSARPYLYPHQFYSDSIVRASRVPYIVSYWSAYNFSGFGDYMSTVDDLFNYDKAYYDGKLLPANRQDEMYTPVKLNNGNKNAANFGLGWEVWGDTSLGKVVYHNGNSTGLSCILIRNISKHQTIIIFDNIHNNNSEALGFTTLKMLNGIPVKPPQKSLAAVYGRLLVKDGADSARKTMLQLRNDTTAYYLSEDEMNLLGYNLLGGPYNPNPYRFPEVIKYDEALATFKLNTELFPESWNVYDSYGEALAKTGQKDEAIRMYRKSIELNPKNEDGKKVLEKLIKE